MGKAASAEDVAFYRAQCAAHYERDQTPIPARAEVKEPTPIDTKLMSTKICLDMWANWVSENGLDSLAYGAPRQSPGAPDARIHSIEDMEIENDKHIVKALDVTIWELPLLERRAIMVYYHIESHGSWVADWEKLFHVALRNLHQSLGSRLAC